MPVALPIAAIGGSLISGLLGSHAASSASTKEQQSAQEALDFQKQIFQTQENNQQPFLQAGQQSIGTLMSDLQSGKFNPGAVPQFNGTFSAPTLEQAQQTPGYQFSAQQGAKGILQASAASGGAISGGTAKSLQGYETNLANSTYNDVFNRALQTYGTQLQGYGAQLQGYQTGAQVQNQLFNQELAPAQLGEGAVQSINNTGSQVATNTGSLMTQQGNAAAAGTVGSSNALSQGIIGGIDNATQQINLGQLLKQLKPAPAGSGPGTVYDDLGGPP